MNEYKLHLGCSGKHLTDWTNIDIQPGKGVDMVMDVRVLKFPDASASEIYYCHGLEHLRYAEVTPALKDWLRILVPGGLLRLAVPDFEAMAKLYANDTLCLDTFKWALSGGQENNWNIHYSLWDYKTLAEVLIGAGFVTVARYEASDWLPNNFYDYSLFALGGHLCSLNVIARKR